MRADQLLLERGLAASRSQAQRLLAAGVRWRMGDAAPWQQVKKNSEDLPQAAQIELQDASEAAFVSRGGLKLQGALAATGGQQTCINALVSPTGTPGEVLISTGVSSCQGTPARVSCDAAVRMMQDMGAHAAKFFPMGGEKSLPELYMLATTAARNGMTLIEPTGGIDLDNFGIILQSCLEAGVPRVMPHVYSSIIDPQTGNTRPEDIRRLMDIVKAVV